MPGHQLAVCVLGMHRSGTSCLTGCLQKAGLYLGKHHRWNPYNQRGNRENQDFCDLNDWVLDSNGASWKEPVSNCAWSPSQIAQAGRLVAHYEAFPQWGFKDPRTLLTFAGWKKTIEQLQCIGIFRHPMSVAESLNDRDGLPYDQSFALWLYYNHQLLKLRREHLFPILNFDWPMDIFEAKVDALAQSLGIVSNQSASQSFYSADLKHRHNKGWEGVPVSCKLLYQDLVSETEASYPNAISF